MANVSGDAEWGWKTNFGGTGGDGSETGRGWVGTEIKSVAMGN